MVKFVTYTNNCYSLSKYKSIRFSIYIHQNTFNRFCSRTCFSFAMVDHFLLTDLNCIELSLRKQNILPTRDARNTRIGFFIKQYFNREWIHSVRIYEIIIIAVNSSRVCRNRGYIFICFLNIIHLTGSRFVTIVHYTVTRKVGKVKKKLRKTGHREPKAVSQFCLHDIIKPCTPRYNDNE